MLRKTLLPGLAAVLLGAGAAGVPAADAPPRARDLGVPFDGTPGPLERHHRRGRRRGRAHDADSRRGQAAWSARDRCAPASRPFCRAGRHSLTLRSFAGWFSLNGNGEMTGTTWIEESGFLEGPVMITNTHSVGVVRDAVIAWRVDARSGGCQRRVWSLPVVAETWDG